MATSISNSSITYSGGGGGGSYYGSSAAAGGAGGGGAGGRGSPLIAPTAGTANTGGGGGGHGSNASGAAGGSGIVIIRYPDSYAAASTTGTVAASASPGYRIYTFTGSGTITF